MDGINDCEWYPDTSSILGFVADDGRIEVFDLFENKYKPIIKVDRTPPETAGPEWKGAPRTILKFCPETPVLVTGDLNGIVDLFRI